MLQTEASKYPNVALITAYMPERFGTHHSKMLILFRHDDTAQVIIHTANMIPKDWRNLTNGVWKSPILPLLEKDVAVDTSKPPMGSGAKFKIDLLNYIRAYNSRKPLLNTLLDKLGRFDFSEIRAALVASAPGLYHAGDKESLWGWMALKEVLQHVPVTPGKTSEIIVQVSSIATLGQENRWLANTLFNTLTANSCPQSVPHPIFRVVFPTADEIRRSLDGYASGGSIHMKIQTPPQAKQLEYMRPFLHHWAGDGAQHANGKFNIIQTAYQDVDSTDHPRVTREALRKRAAPHIKTYLRFSNQRKQELDWALLTSANISTQAWGAAMDRNNHVRVCSWEIGVLVWPGLFDEGVKMVPTFQTDSPTGQGSQDLVGLRMPYDLPLIEYAGDDKPWCASAEHTEPDWMGTTWQH